MKNDKWKVMKKKHFVTLFPASLNVHLLKDVGMVPFVMYRDYGYDATLVCLRNEETYPALEREVKGLKISFLPEEKRYTFGRISWEAVSYLRKWAREIDVLNLYHATKESLFYGFVYKWFNPKGILYIKLDVNIEQFDSRKTQIIHPFRLKGYSWYFKHIADMVSCELPSACDYMKKNIPSLKGKLLLLPNGIDDRAADLKTTRLFSVEEKENMIIIIGRIGAPEKNHELLLRAAARVDWKDWRLAFIGPVEKSFQLWSESFLASRPELKSRVVFTGGISDRKELYNWYNRAKVCCLTSRYESFGLVLTEALYFGNFLLVTPVAPAGYLTDSERLGRILRTEEEWTEMLGRITAGSFDTTQFYEQARIYSENFRWSANLAALDRSLRVCLEDRTK